MSSCADFKQALRNGNLTEAFLIAMSQAPELHITTWIATPETSESQDRPRSGKCLRTDINLVEGEMINEVGSELMQDQFYSQIQQFHLQQATQGHQTIEQNLQSLQKMFRLMVTFQQRQPSEQLSQSSWLDAKTTSVKGVSPTRSLEAANVMKLSEEEEEADNAVVDDILSLTDLDLDSEPETTNEEEDWGEWLEEDEERGLKHLKTDFLELNSTVMADSEATSEEWEEWDATEFLVSNEPISHDRAAALRDRES